MAKPHSAHRETFAQVLKQRRTACLRVLRGVLEVSGVTMKQGILLWSWHLCRAWSYFRQQGRTSVKACRRLKLPHLPVSRVIPVPVGNFATPCPGRHGVRGRRFWMGKHSPFPHSSFAAQLQWHPCTRPLHRPTFPEPERTWVGSHLEQISRSQKHLRE